MTTGTNNLASDGFFGGSPAFNAINLLVGLVGLALTVFAMIAAQRKRRRRS